MKEASRHISLLFPQHNIISFIFTTSFLRNSFIVNHLQHQTMSPVRGGKPEISFLKHDNFAIVWLIHVLSLTSVETHFIYTRESSHGMGMSIHVGGEETGMMFHRMPEIGYIMLRRKKKVTFSSSLLSLNKHTKKKARKFSFMIPTPTLFRREEISWRGKEIVLNFTPERSVFARRQTTHRSESGETGLPITASSNTTLNRPRAREKKAKHFW